MPTFHMTFDDQDPDRAASSLREALRDLHGPRLPLRDRLSNLLVPVRNAWGRFMGHQAAYIEGRDNALANAACAARDMGHPDVADRINSLCERGR